MIQAIAFSVKSNLPDDHALEALEATKEQLGIDVPAQLLRRILEIEKKYAFDQDEAPSALREIEAVVDAVLREGTQ